jgi:hypothetical protein
MRHEQTLDCGHIVVVAGELIVLEAGTDTLEPYKVSDDITLYTSDEPDVY